MQILQFYKEKVYLHRSVYFTIIELLKKQNKKKENKFKSFQIQRNNELTGGEQRN